MALVVTHNSTADGDPLIDGDDWNANHTLTGGGTFRIPKHIETKTLSSDSTTTFSDLDGDSDLEYFLVADVSLTRQNKTYSNLQIKPNNQTTNQNGTARETVGSNATVTIADPSIWIGSTSGSETARVNSETYIYAKTGGNRNFYSKWVRTGASLTAITSLVGRWTDTSTNITSLVIAPTDGGTITGTIKLYKMVDLAI